MGADAWITAAVVIGVLVALARDLAPPPLVVLGAVVGLLLLDVITAEQALAGFANPAPVTVAALYVVARAVQRTGAVTAAVDLVLGGGRDPEAPIGVRAVLARMLPAVMGTSALMNNTPIVAVVAPSLSSWVEERGLSGAKVLIPLSYAAILGGVLTAVGTSTTLVVSGLLEAAGEAPLGLFEPTLMGLPVALAGGVVVWLGAPRLLPDRQAAHQSFRVGAKAFTLSVRVAPGGPVEGVSLGQAGLRALRGVYCVQVRRGERVIAPVSPELVLQGADELTFVGNVKRVVDLQHRRGLELTEARQAARVGGGATAFFEAVVGPSSPLVGATLKELGFRARYGAAVVAIHRAGAPIGDKLGEVRMHVGDTLLCLARPGFAQRTQEDGAFVLVSSLDADAPIDARRSRLVLGVLLGMLLVAGTGLLTILEAALAAALAMVGTRALTSSQARQAVDVQVIVVIAGAFGLGAAVASSGLADAVADAVSLAARPFGLAGLVIGVLLLVVLLTELVTNNAAAVLAFPVAQAAAATAGVDARPLLIGVAIAASLSFITPLGYQTNLMVYGLGGYRFGDFARLGPPVTFAAVGALSAAVLAAY